MATALAVVPSTLGVATAFRVSDKVGLYLASARSRNTIRGYQSVETMARMGQVAVGGRSKGAGTGHGKGADRACTNVLDASRKVNV